MKYKSIRELSKRSVNCSGIAKLIAGTKEQQELIRHLVVNLKVSEIEASQFLKGVIIWMAKDTDTNSIKYGYKCDGNRWMRV